MSVTGDATAPFTYDPITDNVGCASKGSVCQAGRTVYFLSDRGFMALDDGQALRPIGSERVDRTFQSRIPATDYERIFRLSIRSASWFIGWCPARSPMC